MCPSKSARNTSERASSAPLMLFGVLATSEPHSGPTSWTGTKMRNADAQSGRVGGHAHPRVVWRPRRAHKHGSLAGGEQVGEIALTSFRTCVLIWVSSGSSASLGSGNMSCAAACASASRNAAAGPRTLRAAVRRQARAAGPPALLGCGHLGAILFIALVALAQTELEIGALEILVLALHLLQLLAQLRRKCKQRMVTVARNTCPSPFSKRHTPPGSATPPAPRAARRRRTLAPRAPHPPGALAPGGGAVHRAESNPHRGSRARRWPSGSRPAQPSPAPSARPKAPAPCCRLPSPLTAAWQTRTQGSWD